MHKSLEGLHSALEPISEPKSKCKPRDLWGFKGLYVTFHLRYKPKYLMELFGRKPSLLFWGISAVHYTLKGNNSLTLNASIKMVAFDINDMI